ncbi:hypothetical protein C8Q75DRAFT_492846 [Abortiporus biennis]|nr:hypothetical protein C8Q75DRAFT_492846 [Abortiporus biennis]
MPSILELSHVSRAFHNTALSFPHLWSRIFLDHRNVALQELFLSRSGQGNLFLYVHHLTRFSKPLLENLLIRSANRIQELYFGADVELSSSTIDSLSLPFLNLRKFHCFDPGLNPISLTPIPLLDILAAQTPILSHLGLSKFGFWPSAAQLIHLRSLRTLHFNGTPKNMLEIPLVDVLSTFGVLPRLVELRFASPAFVITSGSYKATANQVRLSSLKSLDFIDCFPSTSFLLLSHLMLSHRVKVLILHPRSRTSYQPASIASIFDLLPLSFFLSMRFNQIDIRSRHHQLPFSFGTTGRSIAHLHLWYPEAKSITDNSLEILLISSITNGKVGIRITGLDFCPSILSNLGNNIPLQDIEKLNIDINSQFFTSIPVRLTWKSLDRTSTS